MLTCVIVHGLCHLNSTWSTTTNPDSRLIAASLLFSDVRYNRYLTRKAETVVKLKSRIWGCRVARMGKNLLSSTPICAVLGICDLCMLPYYFPSVTALSLSLHLDAKNVHLSPSLLDFYASLYPLDVLLCFSLFREVFSILWTCYYVFLCLERSSLSSGRITMFFLCLERSSLSSGRITMFFFV